MRSLLSRSFGLPLLCLLLVAVVGASSDPTTPRRTQAYFTAATVQASSMSTVRLDVSTSAAVSGVFSIAANMLPGDFQLKTIDILNGAPSGATQRDFAYSVTSTSQGAGNSCSLLDSSDPPTCSSPATPSASTSTGAALVLLRCTSDAAATTPSPCSSAGVYISQVYPSAGAGTHQQLAGGLSRSAIGGVQPDPSYAVQIGGTTFTGGPLVSGSPIGLGGPDAVLAADGQTHGLAAGETDYLASVVYLPRQAGPALADQTSSLTFTWTATQRLGTTR